MKTFDVRALVREVLVTMPQPYSEHVIDEVFFAIESEPRWHQEYERLCAKLGKTVVNNWGGYWVANTIEKVGEHQVPSKKSSLIGSYSILDTDAKEILKKPKKDDVLKLMSDYYQAHKTQLPPDIRNHRAAIIEILMEGVSVEDAFAMAEK